MTDEERLKHLSEKDRLERAIRDAAPRLARHKQHLTDWLQALDNPYEVTLLGAPAEYRTTPIGKTQMEFLTFPIREDVCRLLCDLQRDWTELTRVEALFKDD